MAHVYLRLASHLGDRLGHLVRGVNMLMSYGHECRITHLSSILAAPPRPGVPDTLVAVVAGETTSPPDRLQALCHEVEWALGGDAHAPGALNVAVIPPAPATVDPVTDVARAELSGLRVPVDGTGLRQFLAAAEFTAIARQGQRLGDQGADEMGEWYGLS